MICYHYICRTSISFIPTVCLHFINLNVLEVGLGFSRAMDSRARIYISYFIYYVLLFMFPKTRKENLKCDSVLIPREC